MTEKIMLYIVKETIPALVELSEEDYEKIKADSLKMARDKGNGPLCLIKIVFQIIDEKRKKVQYE